MEVVTGSDGFSSVCVPPAASLLRKSSGQVSKPFTQKRTCRFVWPDQNLSIVMRKSSSIYFLLVARNRP